MCPTSKPQDHCFCEYCLKPTAFNLCRRTKKSDDVKAPVKNVRYRVMLTIEMQAKVKNFRAKAKCSPGFDTNIGANLRGTPPPPPI